MMVRQKAHFMQGGVRGVVRRKVEDFLRKGRLPPLGYLLERWVKNETQSKMLWNSTKS